MTQHTGSEWQPQKSGQVLLHRPQNSLVITEYIQWHSRHTAVPNELTNSISLTRHTEFNLSRRSWCLGAWSIIFRHVSNTIWLISTTDHIRPLYILSETDHEPRSRCVSSDEVRRWPTIYGWFIPLGGEHGGPLQHSQNEMNNQFHVTLAHTSVHQVQVATFADFESSKFCSRNNESKPSHFNHTHTHRIMT